VRLRHRANRLTSYAIRGAPKAVVEVVVAWLYELTAGWTSVQQATIAAATAKMAATRRNYMTGMYRGNVHLGNKTDG
jgi:hypothetical protein